LPQECSKRGQETTISPKTGDLVGLGVESGLPEAKFANCGRLAHWQGGEYLFREEWHPFLDIDRCLHLL